jgi:hypothetical protein
MQTLAELKKSLRRKPTTWTLPRDLPDNSSVPDYPVLRDKPPMQSRRKTTRAELRAILRKHPPADPSQLLRAVERRLLTRAEAERLFRNMWGKKLSLGDFEQDAKRR